MALTESSMLPLGTPAPYFSLPDAVSGKTFNLDDIAGTKATLVMFICNHCPYVRHVIGSIVQLARDYADQPLGIVAINANDIDSYPEDSPDNMALFAREQALSFPYLYDATQAVARAYQAACTPDFFLFDGERHCVYRGQLDDARPGNIEPMTGKDLREAIDAVLAGRAVNPYQRPSMGCNIKWKR